MHCQYHPSKLAEEWCNSCSKPICTKDIIEMTKQTGSVTEIKFDEFYTRIIHSEFTYCPPCNENEIRKYYFNLFYIGKDILILMIALIFYFFYTTILKPFISDFVVRIPEISSLLFFIDMLFLGLPSIFVILIIGDLIRIPIRLMVAKDRNSIFQETLE